MKRSDAFKSDYLRVADVQEEDMTLTIRNVVMKQMPDGKEKPVIYFKERYLDGRGLVVKPANWDIIAGMFGSEDSDDWSGKQITLTVEDARYQGKLVPSITVVEVRQPKGKGTKVNPAPARTTKTDESELTAGLDDDDIPF